MGRVTFRDPDVVARVNEGFRCTTFNFAPRYTGRRMDDEALAELLKTWEDGAADENVSTVISNAEGELLHIVPGFVHAKPFLRELDFALAVAKAVEDAGEKPEARRAALVAIHRQRLALNAKAKKSAFSSHGASLSCSRGETDQAAAVERAVGAGLEAFAAREEEPASWARARFALKARGKAALVRLAGLVEDEKRSKAAFGMLRSLTGELIPDDADSWKSYLDVKTPARDSATGSTTAVAAVHRKNEPLPETLAVTGDFAATVASAAERVMEDPLCDFSKSSEFQTVQRISAANARVGGVSAMGGWSPTAWGGPVTGTPTSSPTITSNASTDAAIEARARNAALSTASARSKPSTR